MSIPSETAFHPVHLEERQLRQLSDAQASWRNHEAARKEAAQVRGSMRWRVVKGKTYLVRVSRTGAETSLGVQNEKTTATYEEFHRRKAAAEARWATMKETLKEQQRLNKALRVGRTPSVVVRTLAALDDAGIAEDFLTIGTHALYAYETAAGVRLEQGAMATLDLDLLFDVGRLRAFNTRLRAGDARSLVKVLQRADPSFRVKRDQPSTAVNDAGFEVDVVHRMVRDQDMHPLRMSDDEDDFWAVQIDQGNQIASGRRFEQLVVAATGEMALMRTLHPLDFVRLKNELGARRIRDPLKAPKDRLQAVVVQWLWEQHLQYLQPRVGGA